MRGRFIIPIGGELASTASDGVVASADGIYDYRKGKFQEQINGEVDEQLSEIGNIEESDILDLFGKTMPDDPGPLLMTLGRR